MSSKKDPYGLDKMQHNAHLAHVEHQMKHTHQPFSAPKPSLTLNQLPSASLNSLLGGFGGSGGC